MNKFHKTTLLKRIVVFLVITATVFCSTFAVSATELSDKRDEKDEIQSDLDNIRDEKDELENQLGDSQDSLTDAENEKKIQEQIKQDRIAELRALKNDIAALDAEIAQAEIDFKEKESLFLERAKVMYQYSDYSMLDMLLQSDDIFMFFEKISMYRKILENDKALMNEITVMKGTLSHMKKLQEETFANQEILIAQIDKAIESIENDIALKQEEYDELLATLDEIEANENDLAEDLKQIDDEIAQLEYEEQLKKEEESNNSSNSESSSSGNSGSSSSGSVSSSGYIFPLSTSGYSYYSSKYGYRVHPISGVYKFHSGIDLAASKGTPIYAIADGVVTVSRYDESGYGHWIEIRHADGTLSRYAHANERYVSVGATVRQGQTIAAVGRTGTATGHHLHFEIWKKGSTVNPIEYIKLPW
ncbi:MAG: hypothetical protein E7384_02105 [Ruminococcaceae bacterium]|nr:hypothetical protein [Oscillospiraceae bacterium]